MNTPTANDLYKAAVRYAKEGQPVFPVRPRDTETNGRTRKSKAPLTKNGLLDATTNRAQIKQWWQKFGDAGIGLATGVLYDVLDVDIKDNVDGRVHLPRLNDLGLLNGCKRVVRTPSGGWHLYFKAAPSLTNKARGATLGLDVRAKGGYVVAAPSYIETEDYAGVYEDFGDTEGATDEPLYWDLIVSALQPIDTSTNKPVDLLPSERHASIAALREWVSARLPGERNNALHWAVCRCIENGIDPHELVEPALLSGLGEEEVLLTIGSALKRAGVTAEELQTEAEAMFPAL